MLRILPLFALLFLLSFCSLKKQPSETVSSAGVPADYTKYCASCHGASAEVFVKRDWKYGTSRLDFIRGIREGYPLAGMQGYAGSLSDEQILDLAKYLVTTRERLRNQQAVVEDPKPQTFVSEGSPTGSIQFPAIWRVRGESPFYRMAI